MTALIIALIIFTGFVWITWNRLVRLKQLLAEAWSDIDVQLKRRHDLIPALVETVKGYSGHEISTLTDTTALRSTNLPLRESAEKSLTENVRQVLALVESYPDLKASAGFQKLHQSLVEIEDDLQSARRYYNGCVRNLNVAIASFPANLLSDSMGFKPARFFEVECATERERPEIDLNGR